MEYPYPEGMQRIVGPWSGVALFFGSSDKPVQTVVHRDVGESSVEEAEVSIKLRSRDLLFFLDACIHHCNTEVTGSRHSCVDFTPKNMHDWFAREYGAISSKEPLTESRERCKVFQKNQKKAKAIEIENIATRLKRKGGHRGEEESENSTGEME